MPTGRAVHVAKCERVDRAEWESGPDTPGPYNISCDVLFPALEQRLESADSSDQLRRRFLFLEQLATEPNQEVRSRVNDVATWLTQENHWLKAAQPFFGRRFGRGGILEAAGRCSRAARNIHPSTATARRAH